MATQLRIMTRNTINSKLRSSTRATIIFRNGFCMVSRPKAAPSNCDRPPAPPWPPKLTMAAAKRAAQ
eukprot:6191184-Pleurochrysis_carterae.AAC.1